MSVLCIRLGVSVGLRIPLIGFSRGLFFRATLCGLVHGIRFTVSSSLDHCGNSHINETILHSVILLRRVGETWRRALWIALTTCTTAPPTRRHPRSDQESQYSSYTVNIQGIGSQYRATSQTLATPFNTVGDRHTATVSPPELARDGHTGRAYGKESAGDLPSYGDANKDAPPVYGNGDVEDKS